MARTSTATRPARTYRVTREELVNSVTRETITIPGMVVTAAEVRAMAQCAPHTVNVTCDVCTESVADCPQTRDLVAQWPAGWSWHDRVA